MDHSGFSPPDSNHTTTTMESDMSGVSVNQLSAPAAVFQVIDESREQHIRSRSTTPGQRTPVDTTDVGIMHDTSPGISLDVHNQLLMLQQQVSQVVQQQQQQLNTQNFVHNQVLNVQAVDNTAEVDALRNIAESAVQHAHNTSAQAQQTIAAVQEHAAQVVRDNEQVAMSSAQNAMREYEIRLQESAERHLQQRMLHAEQEMNARFEARLKEMSAHMNAELEKQLESAHAQARAAKELANQQISSLQQELHAVKAQQRLNAAAISLPGTPERNSPGLPSQFPPGLNPQVRTPTSLRMNSPDGLGDWYKENQVRQPRFARSLLLEDDGQSVHSAQSQHPFHEPAPVPSFPQPDPQVLVLQEQVSALGSLLQQLINVQLASSSSANNQAAANKPTNKPAVPGLNLPTRGTGGAPSGGSSSSGSSSSSSGSGSPSPKGRGNGAPDETPAGSVKCRVCGGNHHESACPMNTGEAKLKEEEIVRIKDFEDLKFPPPPSDAAQCRGYKNTALTAIGGMQRTEGNQVYQWALRCTTARNESELSSTDGFPILDRKIGVKLQSSAKGGKFGFIFQTMIEESRRKSQSMPSGRQMLYRVFSEYDLERQRGGMISHQQLLNVRLNGSSIQDLE